MDLAAALQEFILRLLDGFGYAITTLGALLILGGTIWAIRAAARGWK